MNHSLYSRSHLMLPLLARPLRSSYLKFLCTYGTDRKSDEAEDAGDQVQDGPDRDVAELLKKIIFNLINFYFHKG